MQNVSHKTIVCKVFEQSETGRSWSNMNESKDWNISVDWQDCDGSGEQHWWGNADIEWYHGQGGDDQEMERYQGLWETNLGRFWLRFLSFSESYFQARNRVNYEKCKTIYDEDMRNKIRFIMRKNRVDPYPGCWPRWWSTMTQWTVGCDNSFHEKCFAFCCNLTVK